MSITLLGIVVAAVSWSHEGTGAGDDLDLLFTKRDNTTCPYQGEGNAGCRVCPENDLSLTATQALFYKPQKFVTGKDRVHPTLSSYSRDEDCDTEGPSCKGSCGNKGWKTMCITEFCEGVVHLPERDSPTFCSLVGISSEDSTFCEINASMALAEGSTESTDWRKWQINAGDESQCMVACYDASDISDYIIHKVYLSGRDPGPPPSPKYEDYKYCSLSQVWAPDPGDGCSVIFDKEQQIWKTTVTGLNTECTLSCLNKRWKYAEGIISTGRPGPLNALPNAYYNCELAGIKRSNQGENSQVCYLSTDGYYQWNLEVDSNSSCIASCTCKTNYDTDCVHFP